MSPEVRTWWLTLADQYEEWALATKMPKTLAGLPKYTCCLLWEYDGPVGFWSQPHVDLTPLFRSYPKHCGDRRTVGLRFPCGRNDEAGYRDCQIEFCWWMAETIRDYVESGVMPWEDAA